MTSYCDLLRQASKRTGNIISLGIDPDLSRIPLTGPAEDVIAKFGSDILNALAQEQLFPSACKPNIAYYEQYGIAGLRALQRILQTCRQLHIPVILDAKRADIDVTSAAYARALYDEFQADAITIAPYMGHDSIAPFLTREDKGAYLLVRTSNKGARDFQDLLVEGAPLWQHVAQRAIEWNCGMVVGATYPQELRAIATMIGAQEIPLLIPGVGRQGASAADTARILHEAHYDLALARINSSSGICYAFENKNTTDYAAEAVRAFRALKDALSPYVLQD